MSNYSSRNIFNQNGTNGTTNGTRTLSNNQDGGITQSDAVSPRFRTDLNGEKVTNFCYSCKSEFMTRSVHDLIEHYSQPHERFSSYCLYCVTGKVHKYKSDVKGAQFYHDCYRSKMNYDKWDIGAPQMEIKRSDPRLATLNELSESLEYQYSINLLQHFHSTSMKHYRNSDQVCMKQEWTYAQKIYHVLYKCI